ncbi:bacillithiol biosynthesis cysteine-adding enzyme BshC [Siminovitchia acidinfaciens]|uniref:Putative cysteine ligase BshC n=1 Tax=Siminovitchia acidinfaciens TaxID=2321395 RepID=A0A429Y2L1_9BACI|nr:bacillithiol biosynthesis cysteine-adding enzyme BshC [Siminovitchia acidinfaciens]RST75396.1 bacillithiol biosynthesis cysteine-adding enzyme BshC [Siminovitchia acidinfaciens]
MELENAAALATNRFASLYVEDMESVKDFFQYNIKNESVFRQRYEDLMKRDFNRDGVAECIENYMGNLPQSDAVKFSIEKFRNPHSAVVIGGQQAGLLTGPLYTIHKIISIIKLAEQQEKELGRPIVPVFWIAGEDHDYLEINHIFAPQNEHIKKKSYNEAFVGKMMASHLVFNKEKMFAWVHEIFSCFGDRSHTKEMLTVVDEAISKTSTFTEFFSYLIMYFFKDYGLLLIDSADPKLRQLEKPFFSRLINDRQIITESVLAQQEKKQSMGFSNAIEMDEYAANVFYYHGNERELLEFDPIEKVFVSKTNELRVTDEELGDLLELNPDRFSNNVVTRPLMQEWLFPTLAFIAGPGEIAYWGELLPAFQAMETQMPPIVPRLNITFLDKTTERYMDDLNLSINSVLERGTTEERNRFLASIKNKRFESVLLETKNELVSRYDKIIENLEEIDRGHVRLAETNLKKQIKQLEFLQKRVEDSITKKHEATLQKFQHIEQIIKPDGQPQERIWNTFYYLNEYGQNFIDELLNLQYEFDGRHKIIRV